MKAHTPLPSSYLNVQKEAMLTEKFKLFFFFQTSNLVVILTMEESSSRTRLTSNQHSTSWRNNPHRLLTVEVVIFLYVTGIILEIPVIQQYLYDRAREQLEVTGTENDTVCNPRYKNSSEYE